MQTCVRKFADCEIQIGDAINALQIQVEHYVRQWANLDGGVRWFAI